MKLLTFTTLFPNAAAPNHGVFVENRLAAWRRRSGGAALVVAPVPWFPFSKRAFGRYGRYGAAPLREERGGVSVLHPRYFLLPGVASTMAPAQLARVFEQAARRAIDNGYDFDLIDAHYLYPDGVAAVRAARRLKKPVVLTARGSDVTLFPKWPRAHALILDAVRRADAVIAVAMALKEELVSLGAPAEKIAFLPNGVDLETFRPLDRAAIRARLGVSGTVIASAGSLIRRKGHDIAVGALAEMPEATLLIAGDGPERRSLQAHAERAGVAGRVRFVSEIPHAELAELYNAADALVLASTREGWPNVLLEAMACGTPCVASDAGGAPEVIAAPEAGRIVKERTPQAFAAALRDVIASSDRHATRRYAALHSWDATSDGLSRLYQDVMARARIPVRFSPISAPRGRPKLLFTVDTEEAFDWNDFSSNQRRIAPPRDVDRLQRLCEEFGFRPLYFITWPLLVDAECAGYFRTLAEQGRADLGVHLHQWATPPFGGFSGEYYSWQKNLPASAHREKLRHLAEAFERAFGFAPLAHRAGRYGVSAAAYREVAGQGLCYDFSPSAGFDFSSRGGPDFSTMTNAPFRVETDCGDVLVTPVSGARTLRGGNSFIAQKGAPGLSGGREALPKGLTAPFRLSSEGARLSELKALTKFLIRAEAPVLTFSIHSTTMTPGANPYAPDAAAVDASLSLIRRYLEFFTKDCSGEALGFAELAELYGDTPSASAAVKLNPALSAQS